MGSLYNPDKIAKRNRLKIAVAQINTTVGDFAGNAARLRRAVDEARAAGVRLVVAPEMAPLPEIDQE